MNIPLPNTSSALLQLTGVSKHYAVGNRVIQAVDQVSLTLAPGELLAVVGPTGSGKSTLLALAAGLLAPTQGTVTVAGVALGTLAECALAELRGRMLGIALQTPRLLPSLTVLEQVQLALAFTDPTREPLDPRELLVRLGLGDRLDQFPQQLSGGERRRVCLAQALAKRPPLLLADEPTGDLDETTEHEVILLLREAATTGRGVIVVTHSRALRQAANRSGHLEHGTWHEPAPGG